jgi:X-X-X-Leu-X-X-Gly heptad repeat protein
MNYCKKYLETIYTDMKEMNNLMDELNSNMEKLADKMQQLST